MVALPPVPGCLKHQFFNTVGSDTNVSWHLFWDAGAAPTQAQASAAADAAHNAWIAHLAPLIGTTMSLTQVKVTDLSDPAGPVGINGAAGRPRLSAQQRHHPRQVPRREAQNLRTSWAFCRHVDPATVEQHLPDGVRDRLGQLHRGPRLVYELGGPFGSVDQ